LLDLFRLRAAWDETVEQLDSVRRENKNLGEEIKDLLDQLGEGGRSIHELDKQRRRLQVSGYLNPGILWSPNLDCVLVRLKKMSFRQHWKRLRLHLNMKKTKFSGLSWRWLRYIWPKDLNLTYPKWAAPK
jgi:hypothetical protein